MRAAPCGPVPSLPIASRRSTAWALLRGHSCVGDDLSSMRGPAGRGVCGRQTRLRGYVIEGRARLVPAVVRGLWVDEGLEVRVGA
jgi:hypothetical protein